MTNKPMLSVGRELLEIYTGRKDGDWVEEGHELRDLFDKEVDGNSHAPKPQGEPVACVIAFRDGVKEPELLSWNQLPVGEHHLYVEQPAPVAVVMPERMNLRSSDGSETYETKSWNAALDAVARLNGVTQ